MNVEEDDDDKNDYWEDDEDNDKDEGDFKKLPQKAITHSTTARLAGSTCLE